MRKYHSLLYALTGGLLATVAITNGWSAVSDLIAFPEINLSLGVGMLVGTAIRFFGAGTWKLFGILGGKNGPSDYFTPISLDRVKV